MNFKSEKGITSIDVVTATIIITIFISILAVIFSNLTKTSKEIERKSEALHIAQSIIEEIKSKDYNNVKLTKATYTEPNGKILEIIREVDVQEEYLDEAGKKLLNVEISDGYTATIKVENYVPEENAEDETKSEEIIDEDVVKIVTVKVEYKVGKETQNVELSTEIVKYVD